MASGRGVEHHILNSMEETPSHFFKVILPETLSDKKLRIPDMFVRKYGEELSTFATLTAPNGRVWRVGLRKDGRKAWFDEGWHDFTEYHSITSGYFLVFKYVKDSNFHVLVFDLSACEITYPYNREKPENIDHDSIHQDEMESEDSAALVHSRKPKPTSSPLAKNCSDKLDEEDDHPKEVVGNEKKVAYKVVSPLDHHKEHKIDMTENRETKDDGDDDEEDDDDDRTKFDALGWMIALEDVGISYSGRYMCLSAEETERALNVARWLRPKNPSFMVILRSYHVFSIKSRLYVPTKFANKHLSGDVHVKFIKLQAFDGREWPVQIVRKHNGVSLRNGWAEFSRDKNLGEGDICVFELVRREDILLKVSVFPETRE